MAGPTEYADQGKLLASLGFCILQPLYIWGTLFGTAKSTHDRALQSDMRFLMIVGGWRAQAWWPFCRSRNLEANTAECCLERANIQKMHATSHLPGSRPPQLLTKGTKSNVSPRKVTSIEMECASPFQPDRERPHYWLTASLWRSCAGDGNKVRTALTSSALMNTPEPVMRRAHSAPESSSPFLTTCPQRSKAPFRSLTISG